MVRKGYSASDCLVSYPGHSLGGCLTPLQRCSQCILQSQPTGQWKSPCIVVLCSGVLGNMLQLIFFYFCNEWREITGTLPSDCFMSYPGHSLVGWLVGWLLPYHSAEMQSVYFAASADFTGSFVDFPRGKMPDIFQDARYLSCYDKTNLCQHKEFQFYFYLSFDI